jgi:hypothetical protein
LRFCPLVLTAEMVEKGDPLNGVFKGNIKREKKRKINKN